MEMSVFEIIENVGSIVSSNEDHQILVTYNSAYFNMFIQTGNGMYKNYTAYAVPSELKNASIFKISAYAAGLIDEELLSLEKEGA